MITIEQSKKILNTGERKYKDEEIKMIQDYLYFIGGLQIEVENNDYKN